MITETQFKLAAGLIGCDIPTIKAVYEVEAAGSGIMKDGRLKILFEGHRFWKQLERQGKDPYAFLRSHTDPKYLTVLYKKWVKSHYSKTSAGEWDRMSIAIEICQKIGVPAEMALQSASYGSFQIMGENFEAAGYDSAQAMIAQYNLGGEAEQLYSFVRFVKKKSLDKALVAHNWDAFAKGYNGTQYRLNRYHLKLALSYARFS